MVDRSRNVSDASRSDDCSSPLPSAAAAAPLLAEAHQLLAQTTAAQHALAQCLSQLASAPPDACFFYHPDPPTLTPAVGRKAGSRTTTTLVAQLTEAQQDLHLRAEAIRLQTLFAVSQLGIPVALWHFVMAESLPTTVEAFAPHRTHTVARRHIALVSPASDPVSLLD